MNEFVDKIRLIPGNSFVNTCHSRSVILSSMAKTFQNVVLYYVPPTGDLGGALGLFFGASLLSFIETVDFWCTRNLGGGCCPSKSKDKQKNKQDDVQVIFVKPENNVSVS